MTKSLLNMPLTMTMSTEIAAIGVCLVTYILWSLFGKSKRFVPSRVRSDDVKPESVNFHFTRRCNYECGFCFHTAKTSHVETLERIKNGLRLLKDAGMRKINFAGGEPFLEKAMLGEMIRFCKTELRLAVSIVSNGSKITEEWMAEYAQYVDILAVSCDSFDEQTNIKIGRGRGRHLQTVQAAHDLCQKYGVVFKINTVVNAYTWEEDMNEHIEALAPKRWKVFQTLILEGENAGADALRNASRFVVTNDQYEKFLQRHSGQKMRVPESNDAMKNSYLILDEFMRFLDCSSNAKTPSQSILEVGVQQALRQSGFDANMFVARGGRYEYATGAALPTAAAATAPAGCRLPRNLEW